jgi:hypothetical protein
MYRRYAADPRSRRASSNLRPFWRAASARRILDICERAWALPARSGGGDQRGRLRAARQPEQQGKVERWLATAIGRTQPAAAGADGELQNSGAVPGGDRLLSADAAQNSRLRGGLNNLAYLLAVRMTTRRAALINTPDVAGPNAELLDTRAVVHLKAGRADEALATTLAIAQAPSAVRYFTWPRLTTWAPPRRT